MCAIPALWNSYKIVEKGCSADICFYVFCWVAMLAFFSVYMLQGCKKHNVMGERAGFASNYHWKKEKNAEKCQEILMNMFLRELEKRPSHKIENQIQIPYPSASPLRGWEIQSWNTTSLDEVSWLQPLSPQPGSTDNLLRNVSGAPPLSDCCIWAEQEGLQSD